MISEQTWLEGLLDYYIQNLCKFENHAVIKLKEPNEKVSKLYINDIIVVW